MGRFMPVETLPDMHVHVREDNETDRVVEDLLRASICGGADVIGGMPNTANGLKTREEVQTYAEYARARIKKTRVTFIPYLLLNEHTTLETIDECVDAGIVHCKLYPFGRTTKSQNGIRHYYKMVPKVRHCGQRKMWVHTHPEHPLMKVGNRDAELVFQSIHDMFLNETEATIISEHGSDARCIPMWDEFAKTGRFKVTFTPHHMAENEDGAYGDSAATVKPPIKTELDRLSICNLVTKEYALGATDTAAHPIESKHRVGQCACGAFVAPFAMPLYAHALQRLLSNNADVETFIEFTSRRTRKLYGLPNGKPLILEESPFQIPLTYPIGNWTVEPFWAGKTLNWKIR